MSELHASHGLSPSAESHAVALPDATRTPGDLIVVLFTQSADWSHNPGGAFPTSLFEPDGFTNELFVSAISEGRQP